MNNKSKKLLGIAGVISTVLGVLFTFPLYLKENYLLSGFAALFIIGGIIMIAIAFGD